MKILIGYILGIFTAFAIGWLIERISARIIDKRNKEYLIKMHEHFKKQISDFQYIPKEPKNGNDRL